MSGIKSEVAPSVAFGFINPPIYPDPEIFLIFGVLILILSFVIIVFVKNIVVKIEHLEYHIDKFEFLKICFKTATICSILLGIIGSLISIYDIVISSGLYGSFETDFIFLPIGKRSNPFNLWVHQCTYQYCIPIFLPLENY